MAERIDVLRISAGESRGTGFLVAPDRLVTALHVVGDALDGVFTPHGRIEAVARVSRGDTFGRITVTLTTEDVVGLERDRDWICFAVDRERLGEVTVWPASADAPVTNERWETFGFPDSSPDDGKGTTGSIAGTNVITRMGSMQVGLLQLYSREAAAGIGGRVRGYSGGPVIVRGNVVGICSAAAKGEHARADEGTLYAVPLAPIAAKLGLTLGVGARLPDDIGYPAEPFRGLLRYTRADARVLFGRDREIATVLAAIAQRGVGITLLTGQAGSGKSSLLEAGVLPRLEGTHERRLQRIERHDLRGAWTRATAGDWKAEEAAMGRPLLVVLDQLEEAWQEDGSELREWIRADLGACFDAGGWTPRGRLILSYRKEWTAEIQSALLDGGVSRWRPIHLPPLDRGSVVSIVHGVGAIEAYQVVVEAGLGDRAADALLADRDAPRAPTLQVWLTEMLARVTERPRRLSLQDFERLLRDGSSLGDFLDRQLTTAPPAAVESGLALDLLAFHVGPLATSIGRTHHEREAAYAGVEHAELLAKLEHASLLVPLADRSGYRLVHDTLAPIVLARAAASFRPAQRARQILDGQRLEWRAGPATDDARHRLSPVLSPALLSIVQDGIVAMRAISGEERSLVAASAEAQTTAAARAAAANDPADAISRLLTDDALLESPARDRVGFDLDRASCLRPIADAVPRAIAVARRGAVIALLVDAKIWILPTADPARAFAIDAPPGVEIIQCSHAGKQIVCGGATGLQVVDGETGRMVELAGSARADDALFVSDGGDVVLVQTHGIFGFRAGNAEAWRKRRRTDDTWIHTVDGLTGGAPYLVCREQSGSREFVSWFDAEGKAGSREVEGVVVVTLHDALPRISIATRRNNAWHVAVIDLLTSRTLNEQDLPRTSSDDGWIDVVFDGEDPRPIVVTAELSSHPGESAPVRTQLILRGTVPVQPSIPLLGWERPLALTIDRISRRPRLLTTYRLLDMSPKGEMRVTELGKLPEGAKRVQLVASGELTLVALEHGDHRNLYAISRGSIVSFTPKTFVLSPRGIGCATTGERCYMISASARVTSKFVIKVTKHRISAAQLDGGAFMTADTTGEISVYEGQRLRERTRMQLVDGEAVVMLASAATSWFGMTSRRRIHGFASDGRLPYTCSVPEIGDGPPSSFACSPDGRWLIAGTEGAPNATWPLHVWKLGPGVRERRAIPLTVPNLGDMGPHYAYSPDGRWLATSANDPVVMVWELTGDVALRRHLIDPGGGFAGSTRWVLALRFTPEGKLAVVWDSARIDVFDVESGATLATHRARQSRTADRAILSPAGRWAVVDWHDGRWLFSLRDLSRRILLSRTTLDDLVAIDDRARWLLTGRTATRQLASISPFAEAPEPIDLGTPDWAFLRPDGNQLITVIGPLGTVTRIRLDTTRALRESVVCVER